MFSCEIHYRVCFAALTTTFQYDWFPKWVGFPLFQCLFNLSFHTLLSARYLTLFGAKISLLITLFGAKISLYITLFGAKIRIHVLYSVCHAFHNLRNHNIFLMFALYASTPGWSNGLTPSILPLTAHASSKKYINCPR